ncbi:hypothetical protein Tco_1455847 [Tanacetum coccineum]
MLNKETMRIEESINVTFDETLPEPKSYPSVEDDRIIKPIVQNPVRSLSLEANATELGYPKSLKEPRESKLHESSRVDLTKFDPKSYEDVFLGYSQTSKAYIMLNKETMRIEESINVTFDETLPEPKSYPSVEDDRIIKPIVQNPVRSLSLEANATESGYPKSLKEPRGHLIE